MKKKAPPAATAVFSRSKLRKNPSSSSKAHVGSSLSSTKAGDFAIGVVDVDTYSGYLPHVFNAMNLAQKTFRFTMVVMPTPTGLTKSGMRTHEAIRDSGGKISNVQLAQNAFAPDLYRVATPVLSAMKLDAIGLLVSRMIMDNEPNGNLLFNLFSTSRGKVFLASEFDLRDYAARAKRPVEACIASICVAQSLCALFPKLGFHDETRGCIFDYCQRRDDIVESFKKVDICDESLALLPKTVQPDAARMVKAIRKYDRAKLKL